MRHLRRSLLLASMLAAAPLALIAPAPASAQVSVSIGFDSFHRELDPYGDWLYSDRWGEVWRPLSQDRDSDWRPYWAGHWVDTDEYGWTWISDEGSWGEVAYHYGRWVFDPDDGWLWLPGYVWSPAWVVWRSSGPDVGWMPMPPDDDFLRPSGISIGVSFGDWNDIGGYYGYSRWYGRGFDENRFGNLWVFVPGGRLTDRSYRRYALARPQTINIVRQSRNITNYTVVNNIIINRSVSNDVVRGGNGRAARPVRADTVLRNRSLITPVNQGEQIQQRARQERPHGNGLVNSAPPPNPQQIQSLSTRAIPVRTQTNGPANAPGNAPNPGANNGPNAGPGNRGGGSHLFNRNNVAQFATRSNSQPAQPNAQPNAQPAQPTAPQQTAPQTPPQPGGNDTNRERRDVARPDTSGPAATRPENNAPGNRGPQTAPQAAPQAVPPPAPPSTPERNRGFERPQQQQQQAAPQAVQPPQPQSEERNNRPDRNVERPRLPQAAPERPTPPPPQRQVAPTPPAAPPTEDRGNRPDRAMERNPVRPPQSPTMEQRPTPPPAPPRQVETPRPAAAARPAEAAKPTPPADRTPAPDRSQSRGPDRNQDQNKDRRDNRGNDAR